MIAENIRLFLQLFYRPISAMSQLMDRGNWFFGGGLATVIAVLFTLSVSNRIYEGYEAVQRSRAEMQAEFLRQMPGVNDDNVEVEMSEAMPYLRTTRQLPLPILGSKA